MHLTCTQENFRKALFALERVVGKQSTLPILSNILLETKNGQLQLSATNLEIGVITTIGAKIQKEGKITIPAKLLNAFIQNLPEDEMVDLTQEGLQLRLISGRYQVKIKGLDSKDFPLIPEFHGENLLFFDAQAFKEALQKTLFCVSLNESRVELTGAYLQFSPTTLIFAATDSFRLAEYTLTFESEGQEQQEIKNENLLIPVTTLQEVVRLIHPETKKIALATEENQLFFEVDGVRILSRLLNGRYPDYQQIIPKTFSQFVSISKEALLRALKMSQVFSLYGAQEVIFRFRAKEKALTLMAQSQEVGENQTQLQFHGEILEDADITFNPRYLIEGCGALSSAEVKFSWNTPASPILLTSEENPTHYLYIVMPIRK